MSREDSLVTTQWAAQNLSTPGLVFVEVDEDTTAYDGGHLPGAVKINWKTELQDPVRRDFVDRAGLEKLLSAKGISNDDTVVLYGGNNNWFAAYAYWYFKLYGHDDVKLIDGGRKKWELDGLQLVTEVPDRVETAYTAKDQDRSIRALRDEVIAATTSSRRARIEVSCSFAVYVVSTRSGVSVTSARPSSSHFLRPPSINLTSWWPYSVKYQ